MNMRRGEWSNWDISPLTSKSTNGHSMLTKIGTDLKPVKKERLSCFLLKPFCPYRIDIDYFKDARKEFSTKEWIDIILGAVDYNADGYNDDEEKKLTMLTRLLPFIEKRLN